MKKIIYYLIASVFLMFILPWLAVTLVPNDAGMITTVFLLFTVNPIYSIIVGVFAGKNVKTLWWLPIVTIIIFLAGTRTFFEMGEPAFLLYGGCYLLISIIAMLVSAFANKEKVKSRPVK